MSFTPAGAGKILICKKNTLGTTQQYAFPLGFTSEADLKWLGDQRPATDHNIEIPNKIKTSLTPSTYQARLAQLANMILYMIPDGAVDAQILLPDGKIMNFSNKNGFGLGFELSITESTRLLKLTLENSIPEADHSLIINDALYNASTAPWATSGQYFNKDLVSMPNMIALSYIDPTTNAYSQLFSSDFSNITKRSITIKTESGDANLYGQAPVNYLDIEARFTLNDASISLYNNLKQMPFGIGLNFIEKVGISTSAFETFDFRPNALSLDVQMNRGKSSSSMDMLFKGKVIPAAASLASSTLTFNA